MSRLIVADSSVLFHFSIKLEDGSVADSTALHGKPARLRMGDGSLTNTFEQCLLGLRQGDSKSFTLAPEQAFGLSNLFIGVFVVAILGNAAEHASAITAAMKNRMDLALSISIGSSLQVALFVAPVLVLSSLFIGPDAMNLAFTSGLTLTMLLSVLIVLIPWAYLEFGGKKRG